MKTINFSLIKEEISFARDEARIAALDCNSCVRSRGAWFVASKDNNTITEGEEYYITTKKELLRVIDVFKGMGADEFYIDGGFDGADSVRDLHDGSSYTPFVSDWSIKLDVQV
jgi:endo-1,4-beta-mannosidase